MKVRNLRNVVSSILEVLVIALLTGFIISLIVSGIPKSFSDYFTGEYTWTEEINNRGLELFHMGYSGEEVSRILNIEVEKLAWTVEDEEYYISEFGALPEGFVSKVKSSSGSASTESTTPVHTHNWRVDTTTDPTCAAEGSIVSVCDDCGKTKTETVAKTEHEYQLTESDAGNCMEVQKETYACVVCGDTYTVEGELGEHDYVLQDNSIPVGCETEGLNVYQCSICGDGYEETLAPLGHEYPGTKDVITEATCTESGLKAYRCIRCSQNSEEEEIPPTGHNTHYSVIEEPALFHNGSAVDFCSNCMSAVTEYTLPAKIPVWVRVAVPVAVILLTGGIVLLAKKKSSKKA